MRALFVHGMGRSPISGWPLVWRLRQAGVITSTFGYSTTLESLSSIQLRLSNRLASFAKAGDYILVGHSLGGVLLRSALSALPPSLPRPRHLFLLGSPTRAARLAKRLSTNHLFRVLTGDCGQLLASDSAMAAIPQPTVPSTAIIGTRSFPSPLDPFGGDPNDGVVSLSEVDATWLTHRVSVPHLHTFLPSSTIVSNVIISTIAANVP